MDLARSAGPAPLAPLLVVAARHPGGVAAGAKPPESEMAARRRRARTRRGRGSRDSALRCASQMLLRPSAFAARLGRPCSALPDPRGVCVASDPRHPRLRLALRSCLTRQAVEVACSASLASSECHASIRLQNTWCFADCAWTLRVKVWPQPQVARNLAAQHWTPPLQAVAGPSWHHRPGSPRFYGAAALLLRGWQQQPCPRRSRRRPLPRRRQRRPGRRRRPGGRSIKHWQLRGPTAKVSLHVLMLLQGHAAAYPVRPALLLEAG